MLDHNYSKQYHHQFQIIFRHWHCLMAFCLRQDGPTEFIHRRNADHTKMDDATVLTLMIIQVKWGITSQTRFYQIVKTLLPGLNLLERSRFNRRCRSLGPVLQRIRIMLTQRCQRSDIAIIDSFPVPLCQNIRNQRAKVFRDYANIGYNATKKMWFYGLKIHVVMEADGLILNYVVTKASVHDAREAPELITNCPCPLILADVGYVGQQLKHYFRAHGYELWTPYRANMRGADQHNSRQLKRLRRRIESCFACLNQDGAEHNLTRSLSGFQTRLELIIFVYNLHHMRFITN